MVHYFIFFFLHLKVNNRIPRALWRRYGHDDVYLRLLHPRGNNNFLCCGQVRFSSISLKIKREREIFLSYCPQTVNSDASFVVLLSVRLVLLRTKVHSACGELSRAGVSGHSRAPNVRKKCFAILLDQG